MNSITQMTKARAGEISSAMIAVARIENLKPEFVREEVARGRMVIPTNINHKNLNPIGIGINAKCKVNANIGRSPNSSDISHEIEKLNICVKHGADTVMDLSTGENLNDIRQKIIEASTIPVGTVPIYQAVNDVEFIEDLKSEDLVEVIRLQAEQGVDYMTIHCGLLREIVPIACKRKLGIVSRGGALIASWMKINEQENPFYTQFDKILEVCREFDVTLSLGDGLRPGCLADASDDAQFAELDVLGELTQKCWDADVQVMIEGPGHIPFDEVAMNVERQIEVCKEAPFYVLGPIVCDIAPGYDHITSAIGATAAATAGAAMLCYVTPKEHLGLPEADDVRTGIISYKIAAHAADVARHRPGARDRDDKMAEARKNFDWEKQFELSLDPDRAREYFDMHNAAKPEQKQEFCSMCGEKFCAVRNSQKLN